MRSKLEASTALTPSRPRPLGSPIAGRAGAIALAGDDDDRLLLGAILFGGAPKRQDLAGWDMQRRARRDRRIKLVTNRAVGEQTLAA